jgi:hypothetical protein
MRHQILKCSVSLLSFLVGVAIASLLNHTRSTSPSEVSPNNLDSATNQSVSEPQAPANPATYEWEETFSNDTDIGRRRKNKVEVRCVSRNDEIFAEIEFFSLSKTREWTRKQSLKFDDLNYVACDANITDFNNDGFKDLTFISGQAARGSNEIRTLLIYDSKKDVLIHIKNSAEYPNLAYNKKLDCVDAWAVHGATTTIFLRLEGDRLREFASVGTGAERIVTITRRSGEQVVVRREPMSEDEVFSKYSTFDPPS